MNDKTHSADRYKTHADKQVFVERQYHVVVKSTDNGSVLCGDLNPSSAIYELHVSGLVPLHPSVSQSVPVSWVVKTEYRR